MYPLYSSHNLIFVWKDVRLNSTHYIIMRIHNKIELKNIAITHSADVDYKDPMKIYREYTSKKYSF